jgi:L-fuconate dehydratase
MRDGRYLAPEAPGFSAEMDRDTLARFRFPDGKIWSER